MFSFIQKLRRYELDKSKLTDDLKQKMEMYNKAYEMYVSTNDNNSEFMIKSGLELMDEKLLFDLDTFIDENKNNLSSFRSEKKIGDVQYPDSSEEMVALKDTTSENLKIKGIHEGAEFYLKNTGDKVNVVSITLAPYQFQNGMFDTAISFNDNRIVLLHEFDDYITNVKPQPKKEITNSKEDVQNRIEMLTEMMLEAKHEGYADQEKILSDRIELLTEMLNEM